MSTTYTEAEDELYREYLIATGRDPDSDPTLQRDVPESWEVRKHAVSVRGRRWTRRSLPARVGDVPSRRQVRSAVRRELRCSNRLLFGS